MYIESVQLLNYRNYGSLELVFDKGTNLFFGDNAQGKTNILESLYMCGTTKSHRGSKDRDIVRFDQNESHIRMIVHKNTVTYKIDMHLRKKGSKSIAINGLPIKKARELMGIVNMVFFSPEDLYIIKNGPAERRRFVDIELCQLDQIYLNDLASYNKIIGQRNHLLKDLYYNRNLIETLDIWDEQMVRYGRNIIKKRHEFIEELNELITPIHMGLTRGKESIIVRYEPNIIEEEFRKNLQLSRDKDMKMKMTSCGPHRDDICVILNGIDIRKYGSQGQQRTAALSLKLSEIYLVKKRINDTPVLLLDDVLSELDSSRQGSLLDQIHDIQTMITCTGMEDFKDHHFPIHKLFRVTQGQVADEGIEKTAYTNI